MHQTLADLVKDAKSRIREITAEELHAEMENSRKHVIVDVREPGEYQSWRISGAVLIPRGVLEPAVDLDNPQRNQVLANARGEKVVLYCGTGGRSALAADVLQKMGFTDVESLAGGITNWRNTGYPIEQN
jgi:rhodanese-related sulfurtransferase